MFLEILTDAIPLVAVLALAAWAMVISMARDFEGY
jgi:hypothetical protein